MATKIKKSAMTDKYHVETDYNIMSYIYDSAGTIVTATDPPMYPNLFVTRGEKVFISGYWNEDNLSWLELNRDNGLIILSSNFVPLTPCTYRFTFNGFMTSSTSSIYAPHTCWWRASIKDGDEEIASITPRQINGSFSYSFSGYTSRKPDSVTFTDTSGYYQSFTIDLVSTDFTKNDSYMDCTINVSGKLVLLDNNQLLTISLTNSSGASTTGRVYIMNPYGSVVASSSTNSDKHEILVTGITVNKSTHPARAKVIWYNNNSEEVFDLNITTPNDITSSSPLTLQQTAYGQLTLTGWVTFEGDDIQDGYDQLLITPVIKRQNGTENTDHSIPSSSIEFEYPYFHLYDYPYNLAWDWYLDGSELIVSLVHNYTSYSKTISFFDAGITISGNSVTYDFGQIDFNSNDL